MAENFESTMKRGDTSPSVRMTVKNASDRTAPDWTNAVVRFIMWDIVDGVFVELIDVPAVVEAPADSSGTLRHDWVAGQTEAVGRFPAIFRVTDGLAVESYPSEGYIWINVEERGT